MAATGKATQALCQRPLREAEKQKHDNNREHQGACKAFLKFLVPGGHRLLFFGEGVGLFEAAPLHARVNNGAYAKYKHGKEYGQGYIYLYTGRLSWL